MNKTRFTSFLRPLAYIALAVLGVFAQPRAQALTTASLAAANLPGKTLTFTIVGGNAPFETSGTFSIVFGTNATYTMPLSDGNAAFRSGTYTVTTDSIGTVIKLNGYILNNSTVEVVILPTGNDLRSQFEMYTTGANKNGVVVFSTGGTGGSGSAPVVTSATTTTATVGSPFSFQITTNPAATSFTNAGGSSPVAINPTTGLVTGTFNTAGTTNFSFTATNAAGSSTVTTVTVTASAGTGGVPSVTSAATATATVGQPFTYQITATGSPTAYAQFGGNTGVTLDPRTGRVTHTFNAAGTFTFGVAAANASGNSVTTIVTVTVTGSATGTIANDDLLPANLIGRTLAFTITSPTNTLEDGPNAYNLTLQSGSLYQRTAQGWTWLDGGYTATSALADGGVRLTTLRTTGSWSNSSLGYAVNISLSHINGVGRFTVSDVNDARRANSGTFTLSGTTTPVTPAVVIAAPNIGAVAGTYSGQQFSGVPGPTAASPFGDFVASVTPGGVLSAQGGTITGRVDASGNVTFDATGSNIVFGYTTGRIENGRLTATGQILVSGRLIATYRIDAPRTTTTTTTAAATVSPGNFVGYRNRVGQTFEFTVTGATSGSVWGTDAYTDDSSVARAAVHAGVVSVGQTKIVTVTILPGQASYPASTRNGVTTSSWGSWSGSYSFAGTGVLTGNAVATARPATAPGFTAGAGTLAAGGRLVCPIAVTGGGTFSYQWFLNNVAIAGATANPYIVESVGASNAGTYSVDVTNALGTARLTAGTVTITSVGAPVIALNPLSKTVTPGGTFTMATNASGTGNAFQWFRNGATLAGETGAILLRQNANASDAGNYTVRITNSAGTVTSSAGAVTLSPTASRPANISVRASVAAGQNIIPGFFVQGIGTKRVIVRAVGPGLNQFNVGGTMADPKLELFRGSTKIAENDNWDGTAATASAFTSVGAFGLTAGSRDAAIVTNLAAGESYTAVVTGVSNGSGVVLIEVYDADTVATSTSRLVNVSVRGNAGTGDSTLILGLVIGGDGQRTLLVRGVGPQLAAFGVTGTLADPRLQIFDSAQRAVLGNDNWGQADFLGELVQASSYVGAFALEPGSRDAATLSLLDPGAYTIHLSGAGTATGEALVEVYEVP